MVIRRKRQQQVFSTVKAGNRADPNKDPEEEDNEDEGEDDDEEEKDDESEDSDSSEASAQTVPTSSDSEQESLDGSEDCEKSDVEEAEEDDDEEDKGKETGLTAEDLAEFDTLRGASQEKEQEPKKKDEKSGEEEEKKKQEKPGEEGTKEANKDKEEKENKDLGEVVEQQRASSGSQFDNANSVTHKAEWDKFNRQALDRKKFPQSLASHFVRDKNDLFRQWLECSQDWSKVEITIQRKAEKLTLNRKEREGLKSRDIYQKYPKAKAEQLMRSLKERNLWYWDPDFDQDEEEIYYYVGKGDLVRNDDMTKESTAVTVRDANNKELVEALTTGDGPLLAGLQPAARVANEAGQQALTQALTDEKVDKKKAKKEKKDKTEKMEPKTSEELAVSQMEECLKKGAEARKYAISLGTLEYSGDLVKELLKFNTKMEEVYKKMQQLRQEKTANPKCYQKFFAIIEEKAAWFDKAESAAKALLSGLKTKKGKANRSKGKKAGQEGKQAPQPNHTHRFCQGMLGCGRANVSEICDLARANIKDGLPSAALEAFSSLGTGGRHAANQERDLHKWLHSLWGVKLTVYKVTMNLIVDFEKVAQPVDVPFLLPHEILHAVYEAGPLQFARSMTGHRSSESISHFWKHCCSLDEWRNHPCLTNPDLYHCTIPLCLHTDGAEFYSNSEYICWSMSSVLAEGHVFDTRYPLVVLPHQCIQTDEVKSHVHDTVAKVIGWSLQAAWSGVFPEQGFMGEPLKGHRLELKGKPLAGGKWKCVYFGFRADEKARKETNFFTRTYQHSKLCMNCLAEQHNKHLLPHMLYKNFHSSAAHRLAPIGTILNC
ncbi:unnamed protein product [Cladocopium goreaui]|uniref:Uncharacterized protein n=1 Tax=Cladocopium goreaui TaxID=2562237 RepID=A0A9P1FUZ0_9DINO|nr:unnamed protein product [Cladocopium goreaui]